VGTDTRYRIQTLKDIFFLAAVKATLGIGLFFISFESAEQNLQHYFNGEQGKLNS
jgi:hypothetical protein